MTVSDFYHITVCSLPDYEDLVAEIYINDKFVSLMSQEKAEGQFLLELGPGNDNESTVFDLAVFEEAVATAKEKLRKLKRAT
jgi:hypothetical protein